MITDENPGKKTSDNKHSTIDKSKRIIYNHVRRMSEIRQLPARVKAALLLITGLAIGAWYSHGIATGLISDYSQPRLIFEIMILLTFVWMLIWTLARHVHGAQKTDSGSSWFTSPGGPHIRTANLWHTPPNQNRCRTEAEQSQNPPKTSPKNPPK
jgi:hypothetical protein